MKMNLEKLKQLAKEAEKKLSQNCVYTQNFGWVLKRDYENPRFSFLKRDKGVPIIIRGENKLSDEVEVDAFGKRKKVKQFKQSKIEVVASEFYEWQELCSSRRYANKINSEGIKNLIENEKEILIDKISFI